MDKQMALRWVGHDACVHCKDPVTGHEESFSGTLGSVDETWIVVDWGWGVRIDAVVGIHHTDEPCPSVPDIREPRVIVDPYPTDQIGDVPDDDDLERTNVEREE